MQGIDLSSLAKMLQMSQGGPGGAGNNAMRNPNDPNAMNALAMMPNPSGAGNQSLPPDLNEESNPRIVSGGGNVGGGNSGGLGNFGAIGAAADAAGGMGNLAMPLAGQLVMGLSGEGGGSFGDMAEMVQGPALSGGKALFG